MMTLILGFGVLLAGELLFRLPFDKELRSIKKYASSPLSVVRSKYSSDERKARLLLAYSLRLGRSSVALLGYLLIFILPLFAAGYVEFKSLDVMMQNLTSVSFILYSFALAAVYAIGRRYVQNGKLFKS